MKSKTVNNVIFAVSFLLFLFILYRYGFGEFVANVQKVGFKLLPIIGVWLGVYVLNTCALRLVAGRDLAHRIGLGRLFALLVSSFSLNYITPFVALGGEVYKTNVLMEYTDAPRAASTVANYYSLHVLSHVLFWMLGLVYFVFNVQMTGDLVQILLMIGVFIVAMISLFYAIFYRNFLSGAVCFLARIIRPKSLGAKLRAAQPGVEKTAAQMKEFYVSRRGSFLLGVFAELLARLFSCVEIMIILSAIDIDMTFGQAMFFVGLSSLLLNLLFFIPLQMGSREGIFYMIMTTVGISSGVGVYISLITRIRELAWIFIGLMFLPINKIRTRQHSKGNPAPEVGE